MFKHNHKVTLGLGGQEFLVLQASGVHSLAKFFSYQIKICLDDLNQASNFLKQSATLTFLDSSNNIKIVNGIVSEIKTLNFSETYNSVVLNFSSRLKLLTLDCGYKVFRNLTIVEIIESLLLKSGYFNGNIIKHLINHYPILKYYVQQDNESDYVFLQHLLSRFGLFMFEVARDIYICDYNFTLNAHNNLIFNPSSDASFLSFDFYSAILKQKITKHEYRVRGYSYDNAHIATSTNRNYYDYFANDVYDYEDACKLKQQFDNFELNQAWQLELKSNICFLGLGSTFELELNNVNYKLYPAKIKEEILLVNHKSPQAYYQYKNTILAIKHGSNYQNKILPRDNMVSFYSGKIKSNSNYASIDENGAYLFTPDFEDKNNLANNDKRALNIANYGGNCEAFNFAWQGVMLNNTNITMASLFGNINRPIILGAKDCQASLNTVVQKNKTNHYIKTKADNVILLDDKKDNNSILFTTYANNSSIKLIDANQGISFTSNSKINVQAKQNIDSDVNDNLIIDACNINYKVKIADYTAKNINIKTDNKFSLDADKLKVNSINYALNALSLNYNTKNYKIDGRVFSATSKTQKFIARQNINITADEIAIKALGGIICLDKSGNVSISGATFIKASSYNISAKPGNVSSSISPDSNKDIKKLDMLSFSEISLAAVKYKIPPNIIYHNNNKEFRIKMVYNNKEVVKGYYQIIYNNKEYFGKLNKGKTLKLVAKDNQIISVNGYEIINPSNKYLQHPLNINISHCKIVNEELKIQCLVPPVVIDHYNDKLKLTNDELDYFKKDGNALIFIHGYNVPYGSYNNYVNNVEQLEMHNDGPSNLRAIDEYLVKVNNYRRTMAYTNYELHTLPFFRDNIPNNIPDNLLQGTDGINWLVNMEYNLNRAAGFFDKNFDKYTRIIGVLWPGALHGEKNFAESEEDADSSGKKLVELIQQLHNSGIKINIVAHSLGNRVMLKALDYLGRKEKNIIERVILWQAAVAATALSKNPENDTSIKQNHQFIYASKAVKKITILYSKHDNALKPWYDLNAIIGVSFNQLIKLQRGKLKKLHDEKIEELQKKYPGRYLGVAPALGAVGIWAGDQVDYQKITMFDQDNILTEHSCMKKPSDFMFYAVYKKFVINKINGIAQFGKYII